MDDERNKLYPYEREFPRFGRMPEQILVRLRMGTLVDNSWHNDVSPSFASVRGNNLMVEKGDMKGVPIFWVNAEDPKDRDIDANEHRFLVGIDDFAFTTDDVSDALDTFDALEQQVSVDLAEMGFRVSDEGGGVLRWEKRLAHHLVLIVTDGLGGLPDDTGKAKVMMMTTHHSEELMGRDFAKAEDAVRWLCGNGFDEWPDVRKQPGPDYGPRFMWIIGSIREQYHDLPDLPSGAITLWDRRKRKVVMQVAEEYAQLMVLEKGEDCPFTDLARWLNRLRDKTLKSEGIPC